MVFLWFSYGLQLIPPSPDPVPGELRGLHRAVRACADAGGEGVGAPHVATAKRGDRWGWQWVMEWMDGWINRYYVFNSQRIHVWNIYLHWDYFKLL